MLDLTLPTMTCGHCVQTVTKTVQALDPQARLEIDLPAHRVQIESSLPDETLRQALADEGYASAA
jgi:copper chaperone